MDEHQAEVHQAFDQEPFVHQVQDHVDQELFALVDEPYQVVLQVK
jgi:hypothetical protein